MSKEQPAIASALEEAFQALPPLDSAEFREWLLRARTDELKPEVLARAYRALGADHPNARATLERLFRRSGDRWDHLSVMVRRARHHARKQRDRENGGDFEDVMLEALARIVAVLPTKRGEFAERAWGTFCRNELVEVWRKKFGRKGNRLGPRKLELSNDDLLAPGLDSEAEQGPRLDDQLVELVRREVDKIGDPITREVARASWLSGEIPRVSGPGKDDVPSLETQFPDLNRHQLNRRRRHVLTQIKLALRADPVLSKHPDAMWLLEKRTNLAKASK